MDDIENIDKKEQALERELEKLDPASIPRSIMEAFDMIEQLAPYMRAEYKENPGKYDNGKTVAECGIIAAAARRARADGKDIPPLRAEEPETEQLQFDFPSEKEDARRKHIEEAHRRRELAQREGAIIAGNTRLATIGIKKLGFEYFTSAVCKVLPKDIKDYMIDDQGRINLYDLTGGDKSTEEVLQEVDELHTAFLMWLLGIAWESDIRETNSGNAIIPVYLPTVLNEMRIDPRPRERDKQTGLIKKRGADKSLPDLRLDKFMSFLNPLSKVAAWFGGDLYAIAGFDHYNKDSETVYIRTPYMFRLVEYAKLHATKYGAIKNIFHADIMTENQTAVEVANRIAMGLITRGVTRPDIKTFRYKTPMQPINEKTYTWEERFSSLIVDCPELQREIETIRSGQGVAEKAAREAGADKKEIETARRCDHKNDSQRVNKKLNDIFTAAIRIIMEKSKFPKYYKDLTIRTGRFNGFKAPTNSSLGDLLIITHHGKNPDFSE